MVIEKINKHILPFSQILRGSFFLKKETVLCLKINDSKEVNAAFVKLNSANVS